MPQRHPGEGMAPPETAETAAHSRPTEAQKRYLMRGLKEPGGKLPLFDVDGKEISHKTIEVCIARGWAQPWIANPVKPNWLVCRLTEAGIKALGEPAGEG